MSDQPAIQSASVADDGESTALMEPLLLAQASPHRVPLTDLAVDLAARAAGLRRSLPQGVSKALADLVRAMNCYYSNLIEGHDTHPVDIERALRNDYSADPRTRNLQLEAAAHIAVQLWIDDGGLAGRAATAEGLCELHRRFCAALPEEMLRLEHPDGGTSAAVEPGTLRTRRVQVGLHVPVSPGALPRFLQRFEAVYGNLGRTDAILGAAAAHHRLLWIHPFLDGNGRVARLMSHAMLLGSLQTGGVWSVARGLARNEGAYKRHLADCDSPRRHDVDGRGNLSEEALAAFTRFFLEVCLDQVDFLEELVQPHRLRHRVLTWAGGETRAGALPYGSEAVLQAALFRGELPRGDVPAILGASERQARRVTAALIERGALVSASHRAPLRLAFRATLAPDWLPGLFPARGG